MGWDWMEWMEKWGGGQFNNFMAYLFVNLAVTSSKNVVEWFSANRQRKEEERLGLEREGTGFKEPKIRAELFCKIGNGIGRRRENTAVRSSSVSSSPKTFCSAQPSPAQPDDCYETTPRILAAINYIKV